MSRFPAIGGSAVAPVSGFTVVDAVTPIVIGETADSTDAGSALAWRGDARRRVPVPNRPAVVKISNAVDTCDGRPIVLGSGDSWLAIEGDAVAIFAVTTRAISMRSI